MEHLKLRDGILYDGSQIEPFWAFKEFKIKDSSIVSWIGPMEIKSDNLIDYEDIGLEIKGAEMLHFIVEHFDCQPANIRLCYHRQRLLVMIIKDLLAEIGIKTRRKGDDLYLKDGNQGKLTVSIATCSASSMKIHFAINLVSEGTPDDVEVTGILKCLEGLNRENIRDLADEACQNYIMEISSIEKDITKTRVF